MSEEPLLSELPEWQDLAPLELPEDSHAAVDIKYDDEYKDTYGLLYAAMARGEKSARVLELTERCIYLCAAHYTAWDYRFQCLEALNADMEQEWSVCMAMAEGNAKSYQIWNHRRRCAMRMGPTNAPRELEFAELFLQRDAKNYHIWAHRQALVAYAGLWEQELAFCERLLGDDIRNNSAWNQRAFVTRHTLASLLSSNSSPDASNAELASSDSSLSASLKATLARETAFTHDALLKAPHNESAWNYLLGLVYVLRDAASDACVLSAEHTRPASADAGGASENERHEQQQHTPVSAPGAAPSKAGAKVSGQGNAGEGQGSAELAQALRDAERVVHDAVFASAAAVLERAPACVPARDAMMQQYLRAAALLYAAGDRAAAAKADAAAARLAKGLVAASPVHANWYRAVGVETERRVCTC